MSGASATPLLAYPTQALFDRVLPKNKIYAHGKPSRRLQKCFADEVARIVWRYKLSPETTRIPARDGVEEIQVFAVVLKDDAAESITEDILRCIDRTIIHPIIFEVEAGARLRMTAAYKRASDADAAKWVVGDYWASPWMPAGSPREPIPVALDLASLYAQLLRRLMPHPPRTRESLRDHAERLARASTLDRECRKLEARLARERQFNRKVEVNAELRDLRRQHDDLTQP